LDFDVRHPTVLDFMSIF